MTAERNAVAEAGKLIGYGAPIAAAAAAFGVTQDRAVWLYGLPPVLWLLILYAFQLLGDAAALAAARSALEDRLARAYGTPALIYATVVAPRRSVEDWAQRFSLVAFGLALVLVTLACWSWPDTTGAAHAQTARTASMAVTLIAVLGVLAAVVTLTRLEGRVRRAYASFEEAAAAEKRA